MTPPNQPPKQTPPPSPAPKASKGAFGWILIIGIALMLAMFLQGDGFENRVEIDDSQFWSHVENNAIEGEIVVSPTRVTGELKQEAVRGEDTPTKFYVYRDPSIGSTFMPNLREALKDTGSTATVKMTGPPPWYHSLFSTLGPLLLLLFLLWFFLFRRMGGGGGGMMGNFGRSKHRMITKESSTVSFDDVAGVDEAREELLEIVQFLRDPSKFQRLGGRVPRGVLLVGQPGCGKTLLAKAVAGEADVPFFCISGSDFVEMFVGVGASRVRDLFMQAKAASPAIIFLDEIDAIGQRRGRNVSGGGGHDEREQTLNAILVEMDGFESNDQVIVIAATNRAEILDKALTRSGRFDRQIQVPLPDVVGREQILKIYLEKVTVGEVDLNRIARGTASFSGAEIAALVNEAAIAAAMAGKDLVEMADFEEARDKVRWGRSRKSRKVDEQEREMTAYHEAGHALIQYLTEDSDPLHKVTIIPRGNMGGGTFSLPEKDRNYHTEQYCKAFMQVAFGGRLAEELFCNDITNGASQDIAMATSFARHMVCHWGMSEKLGFVRYEFPDENNGMFLATKEYSEKTAQLIDEEILRLINEAEDAARKMLQDNRESIERITRALIEHETLDAADVECLILDKPLVKKKAAPVKLSHHFDDLKEFASLDEPDA